MTVFTLRNGLSIDLTFDRPEIGNPQPAKLDFDGKPLYKTSLDAKPRPVDRNGEPIPQTNVLKMRAAGVLRGASPDIFTRCSLRFIQVIKVQSFSASYFGKRPEEGSVIWSWQAQLLLRNIDCFVSEDGARDSAPFQFGPEKSERFPPDRLVGSLGDTPGASIPLSEKNRVSNADNYLRTFIDRRSFESIITFVHPDGSTQMLESWKWRFSRAVNLKWVKFKPEFDGTNQILFTADPTSTSVFGRDQEFADTLNSGRIANRLTNAAMGNVRNSPNISYNADKDSQVFAPDRFWQP